MVSFSSPFDAVGAVALGTPTLGSLLLPPTSYGWFGAWFIRGSESVILKYPLQSHESSRRVRSMPLSSWPQPNCGTTRVALVRLVAVCWSIFLGYHRSLKTKLTPSSTGPGWFSIARYVISRQRYGSDENLVNSIKYSISNNCWMFARESRAASIAMSSCRVNLMTSGGTYHKTNSSNVVYNRAAHTNTTCSVYPTAQSPMPLSSINCRDLKLKIDSCSIRNPFGTSRFL